MKSLLAPVLMLLSSPAFAQDASADKPRYEFFAGYSVNADYVPNRPLLLALDQKVSPFFSLGSGPYGFDFSVKRFFRNGLGAKVDFSGYYDPFPPGKGTYCQPSGCITNLPAQATSNTFYLAGGVEWKIRRDKKIAPFAEALGGIVHSRAKFSMNGSDSGQPISGGVLLGSTTNTFSGATISYSDSFADTGWTLSAGAGVDVRLNRRISYRLSVDYDPTFLVRPVYRDPARDSQGRVVLSQPTPSERARQDHARIAMGIVWKFR
jgi:opacity protein-like surface antigen